MSSQIPSIETEQNDLDTRVYERFIEIINYENENPDENWRIIPELAYIDLGDDIGECTIRDIDVENNGDSNGLNIYLLYIPSKLPFRKLKSNKLGIRNCKIYELHFSDNEEIGRIRELYGPIAMTSFEMEDPTPEEVKEVLSRLSVVLTPKEKEVLERALGYKFD